MRGTNARLYQSSPVYKVMRDGVEVASAKGNRNDETHCISLWRDPDVKVGDVLVMAQTGTETPVLRVSHMIAEGKVQTTRTYWTE